MDRQRAIDILKELVKARDKVVEEHKGRRNFTMTLECSQDIFDAIDLIVKEVENAINPN